MLSDAAYNRRPRPPGGPNEAWDAGRILMLGDYPAACTGVP